MTESQRLKIYVADKEEKTICNLFTRDAFIAGAEFALKMVEEENDS
jgi:hypothetical protein